ncbi:hypothetical protein OAQ99_01815 [Candidatus Kapabacteria bacterium]|nr:hypothetical protein [Candidatus Kapabacteria bacterium]
MKLSLLFILFLLASYDSFSIKCNFTHPHQKNISNKLQSNSAMQNFADSEFGNFRVHYDTFGEDAVDQTDLNQNSIPDYVDSVLFYAEDVRTFFQNRNWKLPPPDSIDNGQSEENNGLNGGTPAYDIYIRNFDNIYGFVSPLKIFELDGERAVSSYMNINTSYDDLTIYYTTGIEALKITLAHEYHHSIQYNYPFATSSNTNLLTYESTATYFESEYVKGNQDYFQYLKEMFRNPGTASFGAESGGSVGIYAWSIYFKYITQKYDDEIINEIWETPKGNLFEVYNNTLLKRDFTIEESWIEVLDWLYHTGDRAKVNYGFESAEELPMMLINNLDTLKTTDVINNSRFENLTFSLQRIVTNSNLNLLADTIDIIYTRNNFSIDQINNSEEYSYQYEISKSNQNNFDEITGSPYYHKLNSDGFITPIIYFKEGGNVFRLKSSFPNPVKRGSDNSVSFPIPDSAPLFTNVDLVIYSSGMVPIKTIRKLSSSKSIHRIVEVEFSELNLRDGLYFFSTSFKNENIFGKFAIIK